MPLRWKWLLVAALSCGLCCHISAQIWERLGPEGGLVVSLGSDAKGGVYLGTADGHVFSSADGARSWELRGRVGTRTDAVVTRLVADSREEGRLFAAVWYQAAGTGGGVFRSDDGARTWKLLGLSTEAVRALEIAPSRPEVLLAGTRSGVFRSSDEGKTWERISPAGDEELRNIDSLAIDPQNPDVIYVGTYHLPWKTQDGGKSWTPVIQGIIDDSDVMSLRIDASNPARVFMSACSGIYRSENQGVEWVKLQGIPYSARRTQAIVQDPGDAKILFAGTTEGLWVTRDGGESWTRTTAKDWVVNSIAVLPRAAGSAGRVVLGTERGIEVSDDRGEHFEEANRGFTHVIVKQLLADPAQPGHLAMIVERGGHEVLESRDSGKSWQAMSFSSTVSANAVVRGHGDSSALSREQVAEIYASPWGLMVGATDGRLWLQQKTNGEWREWKLRVSSEVENRKSRPTHQETNMVKLRVPETGLRMAFSRDDAWLLETSRVLRCALSGVCKAVRGFSLKTAIRALWVSPEGREVAVVADGQLGLSADEGESVSWRVLPVPEAQVVWVDRTKSNTGTAIFLGSLRGLYRWDDQSSAWTEVNGGLPRTEVEHWFFLPQFWTVTQRNGGFYGSKDRGVTWVRLETDSERGEFTGIAEVNDEALLVASQSEGLLLFILPGNWVAVAK